MLKLITALVLTCTALGAAEVNLVELGQEKTVSLINAKKNKHSIAAADDGQKLTWRQGGKGVLELLLSDKPYLYAYQAGITVELELDASSFPDPLVWALRAVDANKEVWHFGTGAIPAGTTGTVSLQLDPKAKGSSHYGGSATGKGQIDLPLRAQSLVLNARGKPNADRSLLLRGIRRNSWDSAAVEPEIALQAYHVTLATDQVIPWVLRGQEDKARIEVTCTDSETATPATLSLRIEDYFQTEHEVDLGSIDQATSGTLSFPLAPHLPKLGWYRITPILHSSDGTGTVTKADTMLAYLDPAGTRGPRSSDDTFYFGIDIRARTEHDYWQYQVAEAIGVDMVRQTTSWSRLEPKQGDFQWDKHDPIIKALNDRGKTAQYNYQFCPSWAEADPSRRTSVNQKLPKDKQRDASRFAPQPEAWRSYIQATLKRFQEQDLKADLIEIWNEPDLGGFYSGTTDEYLNLLRIAHEEVKASGTGIRVMTGGIATLGGHGGHNLNPDLIRRMIQQGSYDVLNLHEHGTFARFVEMIDGMLPPLLEPLAKRPPIYFNETGVPSSTWNDEGGHISYYEQAQQLVKKIAFAQARGAIGFNWFALKINGPWGMLQGKDNQPLPTVPAYNTLVHMLRGHSAADEAPTPSGYFVIPFTSADTQTLVGWDESSACSGVLIPVQLSADKAEWVDLMGNSSPAEAHANVVAWPLAPALNYLRVTRGSATIGAPLAVIPRMPQGEPGGQVTVGIDLHNPLTKPCTAELNWVHPDGTTSTSSVQLAAGAQQSAEHTITFPKGEIAAPILSVDVNFVGTPWQHRISVPIKPVHYIPTGAMSEREPTFTFDTKANIFNANENDPNREEYTWKGPNDLSCQLWFGQEADALLVRAVVRDDKHNQSQGLKDTWKSDGLQLALVIPDRRGQWQIGLARSDSGESLVTSWNNPADTEASYTDTITLHTERDDGVTTYEARLPLAGLGLDADFLRTRYVAINLVVNDDDGAKREGFLFAATGMGKGSTNTDNWPLIAFE
ncbi:MAG: hypothetical protein PF961_16480 [Planctomycetota bacterium]|jgi:hypothetical protein|nr:hypothetical protein [Planctomycetota bacterium]